MECSFESCLGENSLQKSGLLKDNVYLKICFDIFGDVSSRTSLAEQPYLGHVFWNLSLTLIVLKPNCKWTTLCGAIPKRYQITLTDLFLDCAQLVEGPPDLNSNTHFQKTTKDKDFFTSSWATTNTYLFYSVLFSSLLSFKKN